MHARRLTRVVNFFWWLDAMAPLWLGANLLSVCGLLVFRRWHEVSWRFWLIYISVVLVISIVSYFRSRKNNIGLDKGLSRLDRIYGLNGALCAARHGVIAWPKKIDARVNSFYLSFGQIHVSLLFSFVVLVLSVFWPIQRNSGDDELLVVNGPQVWTSLEEWLNVLETSELFEDKNLESFKEKLDALEEQPRDDWFSDGSLEATDFLRKQSNESTLQFLESLEMAIQSVSRMSGDGLNVFDELAAEQLRKSLDELDLGTLALRQDLMRELSELAINGENGVDQERLQEILDRMSEGAETVSKGLGMPRYELMPWQADSDPSDGDGPIPLTLNDEISPDLEGVLEGVSNEDRDRAILGDTMFTSEARIEGFEAVDKGPRVGNRTHNIGEGGGTIWKSRARPKEQALLKKYFSNE